MVTADQQVETDILGPGRPPHQILRPVQASQGTAEAAARGLEAEPFPLHISSEVLDDLGQSPVTSRSHPPALDASDVLAGVPDGSFALFAAAR